jgi:uncharacterized protein YukE
MPSGDFLVKAGLETASPTVQSNSQQVYDLLQTLKSQTDAIRSVWTGVGASASYQELQANWDLASHNLFGDGSIGPDSVMGQIAYDLDVIAKNWGETENANKQTWLAR